MEPLIIATILASLCGCLLVGLLSNTPLIVMPGMGINALFTYTIINTLGLNFYEALAAVFVSGVLFTIIALTPLSDILTKAIPKSLKESITVGIGIFIAFIGFQKAGLIVSDPSTLIKLGNITSPHVLSFLFTMIITTILFLKKIPGSFLISIIIGTIVSFGFVIVDFTNISYSLPNFSQYKDILFNISFYTIGLIPLTYSIVDGIGFGFILYPLCKLITKKGRDVSFPMYLSSFIFLIYFLLQAL